MQRPTEGHKRDARHVEQLSNAYSVRARSNGAGFPCTLHVGSFLVYVCLCVCVCVSLCVGLCVCVGLRACVRGNRTC